MATCNQCEKEFKPKSGKANRFCSLPCYWASMKKTRISKCKVCGEIRESYREYKYCSNKCMGLDKDFRQNLSNKKKGVASWNKGKPNTWTKKTKFHYCINCGIEVKNIHAKRCLKCNYKTVDYRSRGLKGLIKQQNMKGPTSIEKKVYDYLVLKGIIFERQKLINGKFIVDAYIPSLNLIIEADGKYWHTLDRVVKKDKAENAYLTKCGFKMLRLGEDEINSGKFKERMVV